MESQRAHWYQKMNALCSPSIWIVAILKAVALSVTEWSEDLSKVNVHTIKNWLWFMRSKRIQTWKGVPFSASRHVTSTCQRPMGKSTKMATPVPSTCSLHNWSRKELVKSQHANLFAPLCECTRIIPSIGGPQYDVGDNTSQPWKAIISFYARQIKL